jgi:eukaryotic-like serine/threonine-protein kinase
MIGRMLGRYRILDRLGAGGMGEVWLAEDTQLGRKVALKSLRAEVADSSEKRARFEREARAVAALNHPNIVTLYSVEEADSVRFLTMEYVDGETLDDRLRPGGMRPSEVLRIGAEIADALAAAHAHGIVHRDLKPGNVLLARDGRVKVVDFGLARALGGDGGLLGGARPRETSLTQEGLAVGTLHYMSPEQLQNRTIDGRSDLFALGVVLFEMATGELPFAGESAAQVISAVMRDPPRRLDEQGGKLPPQIADLVLAMLDKEPRRRPATAVDVRDALDAAARLLASDTEALPASRSRPIASPRRHHAPSGPARRALPIVLVALAAAVAAGAWLWLRTSRGAAAAADGDAIPAIAILPLANFSAEPEWVVDGMTDGLIGAIARLDGLRVISRQSAMHYKGSTKRLPEIAAELRVDYLLEGSLRHDGDAYRVQAQLYRPEPEQRFWSGTFARASRDVLLLHADVARAVAGALHVELAPPVAERFETARAVLPEAYDAYLRGRHLLDQGRPETIRAARTHLEEALRLDPSFAPAHAELADVYGFLAYLFEDPVINAGRQEAEARRAIELDPGLAEAHAQLGDNLRYFSWDWTGAEISMRRARELDPNNAKVRRMYWGLLASLGRLAEARVEIEAALGLDPLSAAAAGDLGYQELFEGRHAEAERAFRRALTIDPAFPYAHGGLWALYELTEREPERTRALAAWLEGVGERELVELLRALPPDTPYREIARRLGSRAEELARTRRVTIGLGAALLASAGELDRAEDWLLRAHAERDPELVWLAKDPAWEALRRRPRIRAILEAMKLPLPAADAAAAP